MATIPIHLGDADLQKIDYLVLIGKYKNRSQAIKSMITSNLAQIILPTEWDTPEQQERRQKLIDELLQIKDLKIEFTSEKSAVELVRELRDR